MLRAHYSPVLWGSLLIAPRISCGVFPLPPQLHVAARLLASRSLARPPPARTTEKPRRLTGFGIKTPKGARAAGARDADTRRRDDSPRRSRSPAREERGRGRSQGAGGRNVSNGFKSRDSRKSNFDGSKRAPRAFERSFDSRTRSKSRDGRSVSPSRGQSSRQDNRGGHENRSWTQRGSQRSDNSRGKRASFGQKQSSKRFAGTQLRDSRPEERDAKRRGERSFDSGTRTEGGRPKKVFFNPKESDSNRGSAKSTANTPKGPAADEFSDTFVSPQWSTKAPTKPTTGAFTTFGLMPGLMAALEDMSLTAPTAIQHVAIPPLLRGASAVVAAQTGTGKTLTYLLPVVQQLKEAEGVAGRVTREKRPRALVLVPSRELALQVTSVAKKMSHSAKFSCAVVTATGPAASLERPVDLLVATPGRLLRLAREEGVFFTDVKHVVVDEADSTLEDDFEVDKLLANLRKRVDAKGERPLQVIYVSAAVSPLVRARVSADTQLLTTKSLHEALPQVKHTYFSTPNDKLESLNTVLQTLPAGEPTIIFCNTMSSCRATDWALQERGLRTVCFHGEILPDTRTKMYKTFVSGENPFLVTTDIASRGLDTTIVKTVVNFDFPRNPFDYLHRAGRTARAGTTGRVVSLVTKRDQPLARSIRESVRGGRPLDLTFASERDRSTDQDADDHDAAR